MPRRGEGPATGSVRPGSNICGAQPSGDVAGPASPGSPGSQIASFPAPRALGAPASTRFQIVRGCTIDRHRWSAGDARKTLPIKNLGVVARDGIEPSTRGFSVRRRARSARASRRPKTSFRLGDRTAPRDRAHAEPLRRRPTGPGGGPMRVMELPPSRPSGDRTPDRFATRTKRGREGRDS